MTFQRRLHGRLALGTFAHADDCADFIADNRNVDDAAQNMLYVRPLMRVQNRTADKRPPVLVDARPLDISALVIAPLDVRAG